MPTTADSAIRPEAPDDAEALYAKEPHLGKGLIGAIHWTQSWMVSDPGGLVQAYARSFAEQGSHVMQASVEEVLQVEGCRRVKTSEGALEADQVVVAMGPGPVNCWRGWA